MNNTSILFFLPSEFKTTWENFLRDQLIDAFESQYDDYFWLSHIVQDTLKTVYEEANLLVNAKISQILQILNIPINDLNSKKFLERFKTFFQEHFFSIFNFTDDFLSTIKSQIIIISSKYKNFNNEKLLKDIESKSFKTMVSILFKISMYMLLHDPQLKLNIQDYDKREDKYCYFVKGEYINIDGFGTNKTPCMVILNPPLLPSGYAYQGIKQAVFIISKPSEEIVSKCDKIGIRSPKKMMTNFEKDEKKEGKMSLTSPNENDFISEKKVGKIEKIIKSLLFF